MKIKFCKVKYEKDDFHIDYDWMILIENEETLDWYLKSWFGNEVPKCNKNAVEFLQHKAHIEHPFFYMMYCSLNEASSYFVDLVKVLISIESSVRDALKEFGKIAINSVGGILPLTKDFKITKIFERETDEIIFPNYTEKDIRIKQWEGGTHYYAYVGNFQVIYNKKRRWETKEETMENAKSFLRRLMRKGFTIKNDEIKFSWEDSY